jgi:ubiquinone biosynthesis protein Coq4
VGGIHHRNIEAGFELDIGFKLESRNWYEYAMVRYSRNHDFEHILTGGPFTFPGEYVPLYAMITNTHSYLSPELAAFIGLRSALGSQRFLSRAVLHYPKSVPAFLETIAHGIAVGLASDPIRLVKIEDVLDLPVEAARARLGIRGAVDVETEPWASHWLDPSDPGAIDADKSMPYMKRGVREATTASSVLVSSSKHLNEPRLRDWTATAMLRKSGPDYPDRLEQHRLEAILGELRDRGRVNALAEAARARSAALDRALRAASGAERLEALARAPSGSVGALLLERLRRHGELDRLAAPSQEPWTILYRHVGLAEELLAVVLGGVGDALDAVMPGWAMVTSLFAGLDPELAGELCSARILGLQRFIVRSQLHYPRSWIAIARAMRQGICIGQSSPALYAFALETVFDLTPGEARERLGIEAWTPVETAEAARAFGADLPMAAE